MQGKPNAVQVVGLGQACVDYVGRVPVYPREDRKMELEGLFTSCGGPAATAMVTLNRLRVPTAFMGSISDDPFGIRIRETLQQEGVDLCALKITPGYSSQFAFIAVTADKGHRTIFWKRATAPGPTPGEVSLDPFPRARILHVDGLMLKAARSAAEQARERGWTVVMDAGTLREGSLDLISRVDILIASQAFGDALTGSKGTYEHALQALKALGPRQAVITLGPEGSVGLDPSGVVRQQAYSVTAKDTTGAGDVFHGAYIYGILRGWAMPECMDFASAAAALKCKNGGGWQGIPDLGSVEGLREKD